MWGLFTPRAYGVALAHDFYFHNSFLKAFLILFSMKSLTLVSMRIFTSLVFVATLGAGSLALAQDQTVNGNLSVTGDADIGGNSIVTGDIGASHVVSSSAQGNSAFYGHQAGSGFGNSQPIYAAVSDNPNGNQNWFFRGTVGGTENFSIRADGLIRSAILAGSGTAFVSVDAMGNLSRSASIVSDGGNFTIPSGNLTVPNGNIGIGTASPFYKLDVFGDTGIKITRTSNPDQNLVITGGDGGGFASISSAYGLTLDTASGWATKFRSGGAETMRIDGSGNVGIGTSSPASRLTLAGGGNSNPNTGTEVDYVGQNLTFQGINVGGVYTLGGLKMVQPPGYYVDAADMVLSTSAGGFLTEKMRITKDGKVGIGTGNPQTTLDVNGTLNLPNDTALSWNLGASQIYRNSNNHGLQFTGTAGATTMFVGDGAGAGGSVGIGTTAPADKLDVNGNARVRGALRIPPSGDLPMGGFTSGTNPTN